MELWVAVQKLKEALDIIDELELHMAGIFVTNAIDAIEASLNEAATDHPAPRQADRSLSN